MRLRVTWNDEAETYFDRWLTLAVKRRVGGAILRYAETGEGDVQRRPPHDVLRAGVYDVDLSIDEQAGTVCVIRIYRARRL